jgi:hypothetical protein
MAESKRNGGPAIEHITKCFDWSQLGPELLLLERKDVRLRRERVHYAMRLTGSGGT